MGNKTAFLFYLVVRWREEGNHKRNYIPTYGQKEKREIKTRQ